MNGETFGYDENVSLKYPSFLPGTDRRLEALAERVLGVDIVVWFTGAGISTSSGLPDYRGPRGLWTCRKKGILGPKRIRPLEEIEPNAAHLAIVELEKLGKCDFLISQNVDNLHLKSGYPIDKIAELHGNRTRVRCRPCGKTYSCESLGIEIAELRIAKKQSRGRGKKTLPWPCPDCGKQVEDSVINFKDPMPEGELSTARQYARKADLMIIAGSTCKVFPAADLPKMVKAVGGMLVIMNRGRTGLDHLSDMLFQHEDLVHLLPRLVEHVRRKNQLHKKSEGVPSES